MDEPSLHPWRRTALGAVALAAFSLLLAGTALGLDHRVARWISGEPSESAAHAIRREAARARSGPAPLRPLPPVAAPVAGVAPPDDGLVAVPNLTATRVGEARRIVRALGLRLRVVDADGYAIDASLGPYYRLVGGTLTPPPGTRVAPHTRLRARAELPAGTFLEGY